MYQIDAVEGEWPREVAREIEIGQKGQFHKVQSIILSGELYYSMLCTLNSTGFLTYVKSMESCFAHDVL